MSDFQSELAAKLARNTELAKEREAAEERMDRAAEERTAREAQAAAELVERQRARHTELATHLEKVAKGLKAAAPEQFVVRTGWTTSGEEFIAKISSRTLTPARSLLVELDRDDDEVLARWKSDIGDALELWRLLEVDPPLLEQLVLQVADQGLWRSRRRPPPFPGHTSPEE